MDHDLFILAHALVLDLFIYGDRLGDPPDNQAKAKKLLMAKGLYNPEKCGIFLGKPLDKPGFFDNQVWVSGHGGPLISPALMAGAGTSGCPKP